MDPRGNNSLVVVYIFHCLVVLSDPAMVARQGRTEVQYVHLIVVMDVRAHIDQPYMDQQLILCCMWQP